MKESKATKLTNAEKEIKALRRQLKKSQAWARFLLCCVAGDEYTGHHRKEFEEDISRL